MILSRACALRVLGPLLTDGALTVCLANFVTIFFLGNCLYMRPRCPFQLLITYTALVLPLQRRYFNPKKDLAFVRHYACKDINMHKRRTDSHPFREIRLFDELHLPIRVVAHPDIWSYKKGVWQNIHSFIFHFPFFPLSIFSFLSLIKVSLYFKSHNRRKSTGTEVAIKVFE